MKYCIKCGAECPDEALVCPNCGNPFVTATPQAPADAYDHTSEFSKKDISDNKVVAMLPYLMGTIGLIVAILLANTSDYVKFHVHTALKFIVCEMLAVLIGVVLLWTFIVPIAAVIAVVILTVLKFIAFVQVCMGKAKDPAIVRELGFLK